MRRGEDKYKGKYKDACEKQRRGFFYIFFLFVISSKRPISSLELAFSQLSAQNPRILPICLDICHSNPGNASFLENNPWKIW
jgi:hypothetical protein